MAFEPAALAACRPRRCPRRRRGRSRRRWQCVRGGCRRAASGCRGCPPGEWRARRGPAPRSWAVSGAEGDTGDEVAEEMLVIGVEGQGGDRAPPWRRRGSGPAWAAPGVSQSMGPELAALGAEEEQEDHGVDEGGGPAWRGRARRPRRTVGAGARSRARRSRAASARPRLRRRRDPSATPVGSGTSGLRDADGREDQGQLLGLAPAGAAATSSNSLMPPDNGRRLRRPGSPPSARCPG